MAVALMLLVPMSIPNAMSATSMLWIKHHLPTLYLRTFCFGHINTLLAVELTGNFAIDRSNASYTLLFDTAGTLTWSQAATWQRLINSRRKTGRLVHTVSTSVVPMIGLGGSPVPARMVWYFFLT